MAGNSTILKHFNEIGRFYATDFAFGFDVSMKKTIMMVVRTTEEINYDGFNGQQIDVTVRTVYFRGKKADNWVKRKTKNRV